MTEDELEGYFVHERWIYILVFGFAALLTDWWGLAIIAIVLFCQAVYDEWHEDEFDWNFGSKEEINGEVR